MTIQIPDDLARGLEGVAAAQNKNVEEVALERRRSLSGRAISPQAPSNVKDAAAGKSFTFIAIVIRNGMGTLLRALRALPHPSAVDDLDAAIAASWLPVGMAELDQADRVATGTIVRGEVTFSGIARLPERGVPSWNMRTA